MKRNRLLFSSLIGLILTVSVLVVAQVNRPYRSGAVWNVSFIKMKPGMDTAYLKYVAGDWKREQEALKKDGQIISYKVLTTDARCERLEHYANDGIQGFGHDGGK